MNEYLHSGLWIGGLISTILIAFLTVPIILHYKAKGTRRMKEFEDKYSIDINDPNYHRKLGASIIEQVKQASKGYAVQSPLLMDKENYYEILVYDSKIFDVSITPKVKKQEQDE